MKLWHATLATLGLAACVSALAGPRSAPGPAPRFPSAPERWVGTPQSWPALENRVVLLHVWTFG